MNSKNSRQSRRRVFTSRTPARKPSQNVSMRRPFITDVKTGEKPMSAEGGGFNEISIAITLLAGISVILFKINDYFNNNIIGTNSLLVIEILVCFLILELIIVVLFLLLKGYSLWPLKEGRQDILKSLSEFFGTMMFAMAVFILICTGLIFAFYMLTRDGGLPSTVVSKCFMAILIFSVVITLYLGGADFGHFKNIVKQTFLKIKPRSLKINRKNEPDVKHMLTVVSVWFAVLIILFFFIVILSVSSDYLYPATTLLLCGSYSTEVSHFPDANTDIMSITIKDTGIPSGKCYIELYRVNKSNENIFQPIDNITLQELVIEPSEYMIGKKKNGVYYLFIDTSDLPPDNYFLHAEVTLSETEDSRLFLSGKYVDKLFYLPPKNKAECSFNQTSMP